MNVGYRFGPFVLDPKRRALTRGGAPVPVTAKAFDILLYLVQHPNRLVTKQDLMKAVWPDTIVEEGNLTQNISLLRKSLGQTGEDRLIVTVARQGYQFAADVIEVDASVANVEAVVAPEAAAPGQRRARLLWRSWQRAIPTAAAVLVVVGAVLIAWQRSRAGSPGGTPVRLAVLPFANLTGDSTQEYLADGLTEELITQLARLRPEQLRVIARTSVMQYKHSEKRMDEIGHDLSVGYALESSLRRNADRLRVTVQLIRVDDQSHLWANDFDYAQQDVFHIEDSVAMAVAREVQLRLTPADRARLTRARPTNAMAADAVIRGRELARLQGGKGSWEAAKRYFEQAIALDSGYALAWAWMGFAYRYGADRGFIPADPGMRSARRAVDRAVALDSSLPEAWEQRGQLQRLVDWDWVEANKSYQRALDLDPGSTDALLDAASVGTTLGHLDEALPLVRHAVELNPVDPYALGLFGVQYYYAGRLDEAAKTFERISPYFRSPFWNSYLVEVYLAQGRAIDAAAMVSEVTEPEWQSYSRALVSARQGGRRAADSTVAAFIAEYHTTMAYEIVEICAFRGDADSAFAWLERAYSQRDQGLTEVKVDPLLASLRNDPRYLVFLAKMRLPN